MVAAAIEVVVVEAALPVVHGLPVVVVVARVVGVEVATWDVVTVYGARTLVEMTRAAS